MQQTRIFGKGSLDDIIFKGGILYSDYLDDMIFFKGGGQKDGWDPVFSGGACGPGEEVQETGKNLKLKWNWHGKAK